MHARTISTVVLASLLGACATARAPGRAGQTANPPKWLHGGSAHLVRSNRVCALGFAGRGYPGSPYPAQLAAERAVDELSGVFGAAVLEAQIMESTHNGIVAVEFAKAVEIDEALRARVEQAAEVETWLDEYGEGMYGEPGFTYGYACAPARIAVQSVASKVAKRAVSRAFKAYAADDDVPDWVTGEDGIDGKICAVGFSSRTYYVEQGFRYATESVRGDLVGAATSHVLQDIDDRLTCRSGTCETELVELLAATTEAVSKGVVIERVWFDRNGSGPIGRD